MALKHPADYVLRTGQKYCWDDRGQRISSPHGTGQDGEIQAGLPFPVPRFHDNKDGTITDTATGLIWLKDANRFGEVTWAEGLAKAKSLAGGSDGLSDCSKAGDWRVPNIRELLSIVDYGNFDPIVTEGYPFRNLKPRIYWTSTSLTPAPLLAWMITLGIGPTVFVVKSSPCHIWPVRGTKSRVPKTGQVVCWDSSGKVVSCSGSGQDGDIQAGAPFPNPRFTDNKDGTVTDNLTNLVWLKNGNPFGFRVWEQALSLCNSLASGQAGLSDGSQKGDWRLPNVREIESLVDYNQVGPCLPAGHPFDNVRPSSYWTSTSVTAAPTEAMFIILGVGPSIFESKEHPFFVWPVRNKLGDDGRCR